MAPFRAGDVRDSQASIEKARQLLGYEPTHSVSAGLKDSLAWYLGFFGGARGEAAAARTS